MQMTAQRHSRRTVLQRAALLAGSAGLGLSGLERALPAPAGAAASAMDGLVAAHLAFGFRLYGALATGAAGSQNLFISPLSIAVGLSMAYNGARGGTRAAMAGALSLGVLTTDEVNAGSAALLAHLHGLDPAVDLSVADSLWVRQ